jgi:hypothetical protein
VTEKAAMNSTIKRASKGIGRAIVIMCGMGMMACPQVMAQTDRQDETGFRPLFDGKSLDGWTKMGGSATFEVSDGVIVGTAVANSPNTFLVTDERFSDFILTAEIKIEGTLNSGFMFRGHSDPGYLNGRVHGYQAETDPSERKFSGGIFEESMSGWLYPLNRGQECRDAFAVGEWVSYRIEAIGNDIRTFVNDVPCARLVHEGRTEGFIGLQVHAVNNGRNGNVGDTASFRNIHILTSGLEEARKAMPDSVPEISFLVNELTPYERENGWELLFDGKTTNGWRGAKLAGFPAKGWRIEDGLLIVESSDGGESTNGGDIVTTRDFTDFEVQVDFRITPGANSGIKYYVDPALLKGEGSAIGLEFQILDDERHPDAQMGVAGNRTIGSLYDLIAAANLDEPDRKKRINQPGTWGRARIVSKDGRVEHWLNGFKVVEFDRTTQMFRALVAYSKYKDWPRFGEWDSGPILLQDHGDEVAFRSIKIRDRSAERNEAGE